MVIPKFNWEALQKALQFYEKERLRYFPLLWGQKKGTVKWEPLQSRAPTFAELAEWFQDGKPTNVAIICGGVSNGLVALCFNASDGASEFFGQKLWDKLLASTFVVKTPRGVHVYLRSSTLIPSQIIARGDNKSWLEIRADGNYIAVPPSLHPSGVLYEAIGVESIARPKNLTAFIEQRV
ncbi:MAG: bifunctional DNA primase/polymerase, partial [Bacteroidales bacterium]|nr:bifunctional DNA primase/polymerase [Bacteroidales bacterium]